MSDPEHTNPTPDDLLADFADRVLEGKTSAPASPADPELRGLEETILRLQGSLPRDVLDEKTRRRMQADFKVRARNASVPAPSLWRALRPSQRFALAFVGAVMATLLIVFPFLPAATGPIEGTAGLRPFDMLLLVSIVSVVILMIWARRRR